MTPKKTAGPNLWSRPERQTQTQQSQHKQRWNQGATRKWNCSWHTSSNQSIQVTLPGVKSSTNRQTPSMATGGFRWVENGRKHKIPEKQEMAGTTTTSGKELQWLSDHSHRARLVSKPTWQTLQSYTLTGPWFKRRANVRGMRPWCEGHRDIETPDTDLEGSVPRTNNDNVNPSQASTSSQTAAALFLQWSATQGDAACQPCQLQAAEPQPPQTETSAVHNPTPPSQKLCKLQAPAILYTVHVQAC